jgi:hypothetical protein
MFSALNSESENSTNRLAPDGVHSKDSSELGAATLGEEKRGAELRRNSFGADMTSRQDELKYARIE